MYWEGTAIFSEHKEEMQFERGLQEENNVQNN